MSSDLGIAEFYRERSVFITGASGFMGKVLVEKLLFSCPDIAQIFILMRPKREKSVETRVEEMFQLPMFERLRASNPAAMSKLVALSGDVTQDQLGLSPESRERLRKKVSVVFHCAATLRLEATLKDAVRMNTTATWKMIELCRHMSQLKVFVHVSTAFCHVDQEELQEKGYDFPTDHNPHNIMNMVEWMDEESLKKITARTIAPHPNCYTYTKRLAEKLIIDEFQNMPVTIARPAIVMPANEEPLPGWVDSLNGPMGLIVGAGKGVIRSVHCNAQYRSELIPVDHAISALITIGWKIGTMETRPAEIPVYNLTSSAVKDVTWGRFMELGRQKICDYPFEMTIWYPDGNLRTSKLMHNLCVIFLHFLPAYFIDFMMLIFRQRRFMVRLQWRIQEGLTVLEYFTTRQWRFRSEKFMAMRRMRSAEDQEMFKIDFEAVDDDDYAVKCLLGARQYCLKEDLSSLPRCRRNIKILWAVDKIMTVLNYCGFVHFIYSNSEKLRYALDAVSGLLSVVPGLRSLIATADSEM